MKPFNCVPKNLRRLVLKCYQQNVFRNHVFETYIYIKNLALNDVQWMIYHKTKPSSHTSVAISHLLKMMSIYAYVKQGPLLTSWRLYWDLMSLKNKTRFLQENNRVCTTLWSHNLDSNKTHEEKAWWELKKNTVWYFEQISGVASHKTPAVWLRSFRLKNQLIKLSKTCWALQVK